MHVDPDEIRESPWGAAVPLRQEAQSFLVFGPYPSTFVEQLVKTYCVYFASFISTMMVRLHAQHGAYNGDHKDCGLAHSTFIES